MFHAIIRRIATVLVLTLISAAVASAQSPTSTEAVTIPASRTPLDELWPDAEHSGRYNGKIFVVTFDRPDHRQACNIQSITADKLICSRAIGGPRTYLQKQVIALIIPGDDNLRLRLFLGFNVGLGAAIWGTVVLAATCPPCAVATGIVALVFFSGAGAMVYGDGQPDRLMYIASGQRLSRKLGFVEY